MDKGEKLFEKYAAQAKANNATTLNGKDVWRLYDTFGFPVDLTLLMAEEIGLSVDQKQFADAQLASKLASQAGPKGAAEDQVRLDVHAIAQVEQMSDVPKTDDVAKYGLSGVEATVKAIFHKGSFLKSTADIPTGAAFGVILDKTSFYAESGGQEADTGSISIDGQAEMKVVDAQVFSGYVLHIGEMEEGSLTVGDKVTATYDEVNFSV